jgi:mRNA interferase RelE/StbE
LKKVIASISRIYEEPFDIVFSSRAYKIYNSIDSNIINKFNIAIDRISYNPFNGQNIKKLNGELSDFYRYRIGNYRIIYEIFKNKKQVHIDMIIERKNAYK